jgi:hypothetical protein
MALITGSTIGVAPTTQDDISLEGAPNVYFQDYDNGPAYNPDGDGFYWNLSGTSTYPVYQLGCYIDVSLGEDVTVNAVRCDTVGDKSAVQKRNYIELTLTLQHLFPLAVLRHVMNASEVTSASPTEKMGIGKINNNQYWMVYLPKVYDEDAPDYVAFQIHKAQFVDAWSISMNSGEPWALSGVRIRGYADENKPTAQQFATVIRLDDSAI